MPIAAAARLAVHREPIMRRVIQVAVVVLLATVCNATTGFAQKPGGILRVTHADSPASMSIHEEATITAEGAVMAVFNNLVLFDQHKPQNTLDTIVPDLATSWSWS